MMVMRRFEWFGRVERRHETENIRAVAEMKMEGKRPRGRPRLRWKDTVRRDKGLTCQNAKVSARPATSHRKVATISGITVQNTNMPVPFSTIADLCPRL